MNSLSDQLLSQGLEAYQGRLPLASVGPLLAELAAVTGSTHEEFAGQDHPELAPDATRLMLKALGRLEGGLAAAQDRILENDREGFGEAMGAVHDALGTIRGVQAGHALALSEGPVFHPYLNRVLLHLGYYFRGGAAHPATRELLAELPAFLDQMDHCLPADDLVAHQELGEIERWCRALEPPDPARLEEIQLGLLDACQRLSLRLGTGLAAGPTCWPPANLVVLAVQRGQLVDEAVEQCRRQLQMLGDLDTAEVEAALESPVDLDRLVVAVAGLTEQARQAEAASVVDVVSREGLQSSEELPPMLAGLLRLGQSVVSGEASAATLDPAIRSLDALLQRAQATGGRVPAEAELEAVLDALESLAHSGDADDLEEARTHMLAAARMLKDEADIGSEGMG